MHSKYSKVCLELTKLCEMSVLCSDVLTAALPEWGAGRDAWPGLRRWRFRVADLAPWTLVEATQHGLVAENRGPQAFVSLVSVLSIGLPQQRQGSGIGRRFCLGC